MIKRLALIFVIVFTVSLAFASPGSWPVPGPGRKYGVGGEAPNAIYDPNGTFSVGTGWSNSDEDDEPPPYAHEFVDDGVTPNDSDYLTTYAPDPQTYVELSLPEVAGTINTVRVHYRGKLYSAGTSDEMVSVSRDGTNWTTPTDCGTITDSWADYTVDFTGLSWSGTTDFRIRIYANYIRGEWGQVSRIRVEVNP